MAHLKRMAPETESDHVKPMDVDQHWARENSVLSVSDILQEFMDLNLDGDAKDQKKIQQQDARVNHSVPLSLAFTGVPRAIPQPIYVRSTPSTIARGDAKLPATRHPPLTRQGAFCGYEDYLKKGGKPIPMGLLTPPITPLDRERIMRSRSMYLLDMSPGNQDGSGAF